MPRARTWSWSKMISLGAVLAGGCADRDAPVTDPAATAALEAGALEGLVRGPRQVPDADGYVLTPGGYRHASCVFEVPHGSQFVGNELRMGGRLIRRFAPCPFPVKPATGPDSNVSVASLGDIIPAWAAFDYAEASRNAFGFDWYNSMASEWRVPPAPALQTDQTVFIFNGVDTQSGAELLQPVLQWGRSALGGGQRWSVGTWYVVSGGIEAGSPLTDVSVGDLIHGEMTARDCTSDNTCAWDVFWRLNGANGPDRTVTARPIELMHRAYKGVLEVYGVKSCDQLPGGAGFTLSYLDAHVFQPGPLTTDFNEVTTTQRWTATINPSSPLGCLATAIDGADRSAGFRIKDRTCSCQNSGAANICTAGLNECWPDSHPVCSPRVGSPFAPCGGCTCVRNPPP
jgi:hypothetical protein